MIVLACSGCLAGCAADALVEDSAVATRPVRPPPAPVALTSVPPADFSLAVSVISPQGLRTRNLLPHQRAARYIVEPDWVLRAAVGRELSRVTWMSPGGADRTLPGFTRQLSQGQMERLWSAVGSSGVLGSEHPTGDSPASLSPPRDRLVYIVSCTAGGRRSWAVLDELAGNTDAAEPLVRELAGLAFQE
ncbi:MAG: hypothetical protein K2X97_12625 [Mycobacteriaceae bacterium]|nr:hypothetical protein [Mycobacteriaceae bacterium]